MTPENGWSEYEKLVLFRLDQQDEQIQGLRADVLKLQMKSSMWGAVGGAITGLMVGIVSLFTSHK